MELEWEQLVIDASDPDALARWWADALGWTDVRVDSDGDVEIRRSPDRLPGLLFQHVPEAKAVKNRFHLDLRPGDRDAEVERLITLGATPVDIGQGTPSWIVLADPEGNEFCVLSSRRT